MKQPFNPTQRIFALNYLSNLAGLKTGTANELQTWMKKTLETAFKDPKMTALIGEWKLEWGPVVVSKGKDIDAKVATNTMFVTKNKAEDVYVVSVAGTNGPSRYGWFVEDFNVAKTVPWKYDQPNPDNIADFSSGNRPERISEGTSIGISTLREMISEGKTLQQFLAGVFTAAQSPKQVVVTGHSLGGALSATLALSLENQRSYWDPNHFATVAAMPTAGATPGNQAFSVYYGELLGMRTIRLWNAIDPVPNGWQLNTVQHMPWLFYPYLSPGILVQAASLVMAGLSQKGANNLMKGGAYTQLLPQVPPLPGAVNLNMMGTVEADPVQTAYSAFVSIFIGKYGKEWLTKIGIPEKVQPPVLSALKSLVLETNFTEKLFSAIKNTVTAIGAAVASHVHSKLLEGLAERIEKALAATKELSAELLQALLPEINFVLGEILNLVLFVMQTLYQHTDAYLQLMEIEDFQPLYHSLSDTYKASAPDKTIEEFIDRYGDKLLARPGM